MAVDFFFLLSGFVVANAYGTRLVTGLSGLKFAEIRLKRLYPLYLLGTAMGIAVSAMKLLLLFGASGLGALLPPVAMALLMIPFSRLPQAVGATLAFPFNDPAWSLFAELVINFVYAAVARWLTTKVLGVILALSGAWLLQTAFSHGGLAVGGDLEGFVASFARVTFSFFLGVAIHRWVSTRGLPRKLPGGGVAGALILTAVLATPIAMGAAIEDCLAVILLFPIVILLSIADEPTGWARKAASFAGALSYPMYITHYPVMRVFQYIAENRHLQGGALYLMIAVEIVLIVAVSAVALYAFDAPVQRFLKRRLTTGGPRRHELAPKPAD